MGITLLKTADQWAEASAVLIQLRPDTAGLDYESRRESLLSTGYELHGLSIESQKLVCVAGTAAHPHLIRGYDFWVHELVTEKEQRGRGYGVTMLRYLEDYARNKGCSRLYLYSQLFREDTHRFYENHAAYTKYGYVYKCDL